MKENSLKNKHIVFVVGNYKNGGVPMHATNLANAFAEKGYERSTSPFAHDVADILVEGALDLINNMEMIVPEEPKAE